MKEVLSALSMLLYAVLWLIVLVIFVLVGTLVAPVAIMVLFVWGTIYVASHSTKEKSDAEAPGPYDPS